LRKRCDPGVGIYNSGAGSAGIKDALRQFDPARGVTWVTHELSDDHRQYLQSGELSMVVDQDPDMQALRALRYVVERATSEAGPPPPISGSEFRVYFAENLKDEPYLATDAPRPARRA